MVADADRSSPPATPPSRPRSGALRLVNGASRRFGWGLADQAVSSLTNFVVSLYIARTLGARQFGAFTLAYVTYSFILNASRGLATDPLLVRFSGAELSVWRRAVARCTGTAIAVGLLGGAGMLVAAVLLGGTTRLAFIAMAVTMPGMMLQDSWRNAFFALGKGGRAFANDCVWALVMAAGVVTLRVSGDDSVFWLVLAWGVGGNIGAAIGPLQSRVVPRISAAWAWVSHHRDLAPRYLAEETVGSLCGQVRTYGVGLIVGLAAVGYVQAAGTLLGPFLVVLMGTSLVTVPEAARVLRRSPTHLRLFCLMLGSGLALVALAWGGLLLVALPRGLGHLVLNTLWRPTYPLVLPTTIAVMAACLCTGATAGLRALGVARRSLRAEAIGSAAFIALSLAGAATNGALGAVWGGALAQSLAAFIWWQQLQMALRESAIVPVSFLARSRHLAGRHRKLRDENE